MKKVQGESFRVRFYRRGVAKMSSKKNMSERVDRETPQDNALQEALMDNTLVLCKDDIVEAAVKKEIHLCAEHTTPREEQVKAQGREEGLKEKALWMAAKNGDCYAIRVLVMGGVDLEARDAQGRTAVHIAAQYNQKDALKTLMAAKEMRRMSAYGELPNGAFFDKFKKIAK